MQGPFISAIQTHCLPLGNKDKLKDILNWYWFPTSSTFIWIFLTEGYRTMVILMIILFKNNDINEYIIFKCCFEFMWSRFYKLSISVFVNHFKQKMFQSIYSLSLHQIAWIVTNLLSIVGLFIESFTYRDLCSHDFLKVWIYLI